MAWSEAARQAALEARRAKAKGRAAAKAGGRDMFGGTRYTDPQARKGLAGMIREFRRGGKSPGGAKYSYHTKIETFAKAAISTQTRNMFGGAKKAASELRGFKKRHGIG